MDGPVRASRIFFVSFAAPVVFVQITHEMPRGVHLTLHTVTPAKPGPLAPW